MNVPIADPARIPALDGLRAVAVSIVFASHLPLSELGFVPGGFGVTLFFVISGYLITSLLVTERQLTGRVDVPAFFARRALRILPPLYVAIGVGLGLYALGVVQAPEGLEGTWSQLLHWSNYYVADGGLALLDGTELTWSLAVEEHFYLVYPIVFVLLVRWSGRGGAAAVLVALAFAVLAWRLIHAGGVVDEATFFELAYRTDFRIDSILWGCVLALVADPMDRVRRSTRLDGVLVLVLVAALAATIAPPGNWYRGTVRFTLQPMLIAGFLWFVVSNRRLFVHRLLELRPVRWLGRVSYPLYLTSHMITIVAFRELAGAEWRTDTSVRGSDDPTQLLVASLIAVCVSLATAALMHRLVERPIASLRRRLRRDGRRLPGPFDPGARPSAWFEWVPSVLPPVETTVVAGVPARPAVPRPVPANPQDRQSVNA